VTSTTVQIKSVAGDTAIIEGWLVVHGGVDLEGETFTKDTDYWLEHLGDRLPVLYEHGLTSTIGKQVIGRVVSKRLSDAGLWIEAEINRSRQYAEQILELVKAGRLGWSSGAIAHLVEKAAGVVKIWPLGEASLTPVPCEPRTLGVQLAAKSISASLPTDLIAPDRAAFLDEMAGVVTQIEAKDRRAKAIALAELTDVARHNDAALAGQVVLRNIPPADVPSAQVLAADAALKHATALLGVKGARLRWWRPESGRDLVLKRGGRAMLNREPWTVELIDPAINGWVTGSAPTVINIRSHDDGDLDRLRRTVLHEVRHAQQFLAGYTQSPTCGKTSAAMEADAQEWAAMHAAARS
jgi:HK97 family phage prohead protease